MWPLPGTRDGGEKVLGDERLAPILAMVGSMASHREPARGLQVAVRRHIVGAHFALPVAFHPAWYYRADLDARKTFLPSYLQKNGNKSGQWEEWPGSLFSQHPLVAATFSPRKVQEVLPCIPAACPCPFKLKAGDSCSLSDTLSPGLMIALIHPRLPASLMSTIC